MPVVDEFGRAIPAGAYQQQQQQHQQPPGPPSYHASSFNHPRDGPPPHDGPYSYGPNGGGGNHYGRSSHGGNHRYHYNNNNGGNSYGGPHSDYSSSWRPHNKGGGGGGGMHRKGGPPPLAEGNNSSGSNSGNPASSSGGDALGPQTQSQAGQTPTHPSLRYVDDPMLCEFLWKEQQEKKDTGGDIAEAPKESDDPGDGTAETSKPTESNEEEADADESETKHDDDTPSGNDKDANESSDKKTYDEYRLEYAWNFLKHFFNQHLDDSWFRQMYSPTHMVQQAQLERNRSHTEALALRNDLQEHLLRKKSSFESALDLVSLTRTRSTVLGGSTSGQPSIPRLHKFSTHERTMHIRNVPPHVTDEQVRQALWPFLEQSESKGGKSGENAAGGNKKDPATASTLANRIVLYSGAPDTKTASGKNPAGALPSYRSMSSPRNDNATGARATQFLHRSLFCVCQSGEVYQHLWQALVQQRTRDDDPAVAAAANPTTSHIPRKEEGKNHHSFGGIATVELEVDCTDPYSRVEYDADGRGAAPLDGLARPPRKALLVVTRYTDDGPLLLEQQHQTPVTVLTTALSSPSRFSSDQEAATTLARALDIRQHVPNDDRLDTILESLSSDPSWPAEPPPNLMLDISLAYLRRVHLYSFYKTSKAASFADVLSGSAAVSQVQMRESVSRVDEAPVAVGSENDQSTRADSKDLLVQRLDDSVRQALENDCHVWISAAEYVRDEETDKAAEEIKHSCVQATQDWIHAHSIMDDDLRARCSFHFCHKLFKDESFLSKHLLKKHAAYHAAEQAKLHDPYMMQIWEKATMRHVPPILVDCGRQFGRVESIIEGGAEPRAPDPEPALWEKQQKLEEMRNQRYESRQARIKQMQEEKLQLSGDGGGGSRSFGGGNSNFVDVDDMKDEVVEVSFEEVQIPVATKKKKKKRKLL